MKISYSAPAKVILAGEHAVVYGKPGLVSAINLRLNFNLWKTKKKSKNKKIILISEIVKTFLKKEKISFVDKPFDFAIDSQIPISRGLGSSAALSAGATAALLQFYTNKKYKKEIINNLAYQAEKYFHKNPSGVDVSASCFGGLIFYRKEFEFLKNISSLNFTIPKIIEKSLYLIDSGKPEENTGEMVENVGILYNQKQSFVNEVLADIERVTKRMTISLIKGDVDFFQKNIVDNQILLEMLGVVSKKTKNLLEKLAVYGVGKITGAGGKKNSSGFILFFAQNSNKLEIYLKQNKVNFYKFKQDFRGLI